MFKILSSASRVVFILMAIAVTGGLFTGHIDPKDYMILCSMVFSYYFTKAPTPDVTQEDKGSH